MPISDKPKQDDVSELIANLKHDNFNVRREAIRALGESKDVRAIEPLLKLLGENIFPEGLVSKVKSSAAIALSNIGENAVPALINALANTENDPESSYWIINAIGLTKDKRAIEPLIHALNSKHRAIRESAIEALGRIGDSRALEPLINTFQNLSPLHGYLYFAAAESLGYIGGERALQILEEALVNLNPDSGYAYVAVNNAIQGIRTKQTSSE